MAPHSSRHGYRRSCLKSFDLVLVEAAIPATFGYEEFRLVVVRVSERVVYRYHVGEAVQSTDKVDIGEAGGLGLEGDAAVPGHGKRIGVRAVVRSNVEECPGWPIGEVKLIERPYATVSRPSPDPSGAP
jgi:hypothetical protein